MQILKPKVEVWLQTDSIAHIARCARVCYASENIKNNANLYKTLWDNKHRSMFRHAGVYYIIPKELSVPENAYIGAVVTLVNGAYYVSTNEQAAREYWDREYRKYRIPIQKAMTDAIFRKYKMLRFTLCIETGIDITREFNRKSPNNIAEQSTRYVDFNKKLGVRFKHCHWMNNMSIWKYCLTRIMLRTVELFYKIARSKRGLNLSPQDARFILPLDTMSKVVYTYTVAEWEHIVNMRLWNWTGKAHPDATIVGQLIFNEFTKLGYTFANYNKNEAKRPLV